MDTNVAANKQNGGVKSLLFSDVHVDLMYRLQAALLAFLSRARSSFGLRLTIAL